MKRLTYQVALAESIRVVLIIVLVYAGISKLLDYQKFEVELRQSPLLFHFAKWVAWVMPSLEILISLMLATWRYRLAGLYATFCLMLIFTGYIVAITRFSSFIPCSCGGILGDLSWNAHLVLNIILTTLAMVGVLLSKTIAPKRHFYCNKTGVSRKPAKE